ncbi:hypothetical protein J8273_6878 [Carpediemonas membranifera]|uniref:Uncharacterized protein n=1 Tax=Carpediemonas membranifera TaxID=201153 RepID=A0A8J6ATB2_9EUKA|nr:hypothetical protein J8273_6878 [Carpediemonas membranifera]|eukprot:KAG9391865.1 hypothetical protein J8273_6878 [Carpediemonas membranifera]
MKRATAPKYLLSCSNIARVWNISGSNGPTLVCTIPDVAHNRYPVNDAMWSSNNNACVTIGSDGHAALCALRSKGSPTITGTTLLLDPILMGENAAPSPLRAATITQNSRFLAAGNDSGELFLYSLRSKAIVSREKLHYAAVSAVCSAPSVYISYVESIDYIASADVSGKIHVTRINTSLSFCPVPTTTSPFQLLATYASGQVRLFAADSADSWLEIGMAHIHSGPCVACYISSGSTNFNGDYIATAGRDGRVTVSLTTNLTGVAKRPFFDQQIDAVRFSSITAASPGTVVGGTDKGEIIALDVGSRPGDDPILARFKENSTGLPVSQVALATPRVMSDQKRQVESALAKHSNGIHKAAMTSKLTRLEATISLDRFTSTASTLFVNSDWQVSLGFSTDCRISEFVSQDHTDRNTDDNDAEHEPNTAAQGREHR